MIATLAAMTILSAQESRFELVSPFPSLPWIKIHDDLARVGFAQSTARRMELQGRVLWIDATANISRYNTEEKIVSLVKKVDEVGFNTIVFDVKPIVGYTIYPSQFAEKLLWWRDAELPADFDPLKVFVREVSKTNLSLLVSLNAFSEGHSYSKREAGTQPRNPFFKPGWGYEHPELQSVKYVAKPSYKGLAIAESINPTRWDTPLAIYSKIPSADAGAFAQLDKYGRVLTVGSSKPSSFKGASLLAGRGEGADVIRRLQVGMRVFLDSIPEFKISSIDQNQIPLMMNPHDPSVQERAIKFAEEIARNYAVDGILYDDRLRFGGLDSDFSPATRERFEKLVGKKLVWPDDVFQFTFSTQLERGIKPGRYFDQWLVFRAQTLSNWVKKARARIEKSRPGTLLGVYAGSWYGDYQKYGNNYASSELEAGFPFLTRAYQETGFASQLDLLITGCYYPHGTVYQAVQEGGLPGRTVEAAGIQSNRLARDESWVYAGLMLATFEDKPDRLIPALQAAAATTQGVMIFDLSHDIDRYWPYFERAFKNPAVAPHTRPDLLGQARQLRHEFDRKGFALPPFPHFEGAPGTGF